MPRCLCGIAKVEILRGILKGALLKKRPLERPGAETHRAETHRAETHRAETHRAETRRGSLNAMYYRLLERRYSFRRQNRSEPPAMMRSAKTSILNARSGIRACRNSPRIIPMTREGISAALSTSVFTVNLPVKA